MKFFKIIILFTALILLTFTLPKDQIKKDKPSKKETAGKTFFNIDSLQENIKSSGWDLSSLKNYSRYLLNSENDLEEEIKQLKLLPYSLERTFLLSLVYKKQGKYKIMFDSLYSQLNNEPGSGLKSYLPYYDELAFSASAVNLLSALESKVPALKKENPIDADYLMSLIFSLQGKYINPLELTLNLYKKDSTNFAIIYKLSYIYRNLGDYDKAINILSNYLKYNNADKWETSKILLAEGSLHFYSGNYEEAKKLYKKGFLLSKEIGNKQEEARGNVNLGIISDIYGDIEKARGHYAAAVEISKGINDLDAEALAYSELGVSYSFTNELIKAKENYEISYSMYREQGNLLRLAFLSDNLGKVYMRMFDYSSALKCYQRGVDYSGENKHAMVVNLIGLADVYTNLSNYSKAIQLYKEARDIAGEINEAALNAEIYYGMGALNFGLDKFKNALNNFNESLRLNNQVDNYLSSQIFNQIGLIYVETDSLTSAEEYFNKAVELSKKNNDFYSEALSSINLAFLYIKENEFTKAAAVLKDTENILKKNNYKFLNAQALLAKGKIFKGRNMVVDAQKALTGAIKLGTDIKEFDIQIEANYLLAELYEYNGFNEAAESYYKSAVSLIENVSRPLFENEQVQISYYLSKNEIYNSFAKFYLKQNKYVNAFELIDRARSRNTMHNLNNLKLQSLIQNDSVLKKIYDYEWIIHSDIYDKEETNKANAEFALLKEKLINKNSLLKKYLNLDQTLSLKEIQSSLNKDENILSIYTSQDKTYLFLVNRNDFYPVKVSVSSDSLKKLITGISPYFSYKSDPSGTFYNQDLFSFNAGAANNFFKLILKNSLEKVKKGDKVIISASPELLTLPFEFLVSKFSDSESAYNYRGKDFLVLDYDISYTPSAAIFINQHKSKSSPQNDRLLLVGNPLINNKIKGYSERRGLLEESSSLPREVPLLPLKYSGEEVNEIGSIVKVDKILTDKDATETNFKNDAEQSGIIHLSTHSFLFNKQPVIFFSNYYDPDNDGFLEAGEIVQLKLNSDLVVLSSCSSGLGVIDESEGILGMTKAFFEAGAKSVVVSLWAVNDKYTAKFMTLFYKNLSRGLDKSEALRQAKIDFIKEYSPNPYYWAAFVLSGNVSKLNINTYFSSTPFVVTILLIIFIPAVVIYVRKYNRKPIKQ